MAPWHWQPKITKLWGIFTTCTMMHWQQCKWAQRIRQHYGLLLHVFTGGFKSCKTLKTQEINSSRIKWFLSHHPQTFIISGIWKLNTASKSQLVVSTKLWILVNRCLTKHHVSSWMQACWDRIVFSSPSAVQSDRINSRVFITMLSLHNSILDLTSKSNYLGFIGRNLVIWYPFVHKSTGQKYLFFNSLKDFFLFLIQQQFRKY